MKKYIFFILLLTTFLVFPKPTLAKVIMQEKGIVAIPSTETIDDDLFIGAESIDIAGTVTGSVFAGAGMGDIKGNIKGDLVIGIGNANISGEINGDLYLGGGDITLTNAKIDGNVIVGAGNLMIDSTSVIGGSLIAGAGNIKNSAPVGRNVVIGAGSIYLDSTVGKEARLGGGNIELGPHAAIKDNLTYTLGENESSLKQAQSATIGGTVSRYTPPVDTSRDMAKAKQDFARMGGMAQRGWLVISFLGSLLVGFIILKLFPKTSGEISDELSKSLTSSIGIGFLMVIAILPILLILAITVIGLPLAGILVLLFGLELHLAKLASSYALGRFVARQFNWNKIGLYGAFSIGLAIFFILRAIPGIGWITSILFTWAGLGSLWLYKKANLKNL